jgi:hypothetical protein
MSANAEASLLSETALRDLFNRAGHACQCRLPHCGHSSRCGRGLAWEERGDAWAPVNLFPDDDAALELSFKWFIYCADCADKWLKAQNP